VSGSRPDGPGAWFRAEVVEQPVALRRLLDGADAVAAATDEATWDVSTFQETEADGLPATLVEATAIAEGGGVPSGTSRFGVFVDVGSSGTVSLFTIGTPGDDAYETLTGVVTLMAGASTFVAGE